MLRVEPLATLIHERREKFELARVLAIEVRDWHATSESAARLGRTGERLRECQALLADDDFGTALPKGVAPYLTACDEKETEQRNRERRLLGRAFVLPAHQALEEGNQTFALQLAAGGAIVASDPDFELLPELWSIVKRAALSNNVRLKLPGHPPRITSADTDETAFVLITGSPDGKARVWDLRTGLLRLEVTVTPITTCENISEGTVIVGVALDSATNSFAAWLISSDGIEHQPAAWDLTSGLSRPVTGEHSSIISAMTARTANDRIRLPFGTFTGDYFEHLGSAEGRTHGLVFAYSNPAEVLHDKTCRFLKITTQDGAKIVCDLDEMCRVEDRDYDWVDPLRNDTAHRHDLKMVLTTKPHPLHKTAIERIVVFRRGEVTAEWSALEGSALDARLSNTGRLLAIACSDGINLVDLETGGLIQKISTEDWFSDFERVAFSADDRYLFGNQRVGRELNCFVWNISQLSQQMPPRRMALAAALACGIGIIAEEDKVHYLLQELPSDLFAEVLRLTSLSRSDLDNAIQSLRPRIEDLDFDTIARRYSLTLREREPLFTPDDIAEKLFLNPVKKQPKRSLVTADDLVDQKFVETHRGVAIFRLADGRYHVINNFAVTTLEEARAAAAGVSDTAGKA